MKVSWNWLKEYVPLDMPAPEVEQRLAMAGLNHEGTQSIGDDLQIDLEITSNRPDCLSMIGVAREIGVLYGRDVCLPDPQPPESNQRVTDLTNVTIECPELCGRYTARVIQGVRIGASPAWVKNRLRTVGIASINNVVDITNYVMLECGQPLHAFDFSKLQGRRIVVRDAQANEKFIAIDHREYTLQPRTCVIADEARAVAIGGIMGGCDTEVDEATTDLLIESASFAPQPIRSASRELRLKSESSHRFERGVDMQGVEWASRRACDLILSAAGGKLAAGVIDVWPVKSSPPVPIVLRFSQLKRILGIEVPTETVMRVLGQLGMQQQSATEAQASFLPPSWRNDLVREIDLIEEVARIHGYDKIPEDVSVPMCLSQLSRSDRTLDKIRRIMTSTGFDEAITVSVTDEYLSQIFSPWTSEPALQCATPMLRGADRLRRSLVPSLLAVRQTNESLSNDRIELFETARIYLPRVPGLPEEHHVLALTSGQDFHYVKGVIELICQSLHIRCPLMTRLVVDEFFADGLSAELHLGDQLLGYVGVVRPKALRACGLRNPSTVAELKLSVFESLAELTPQYVELSPYPPIRFDFNFIVDEAVRWSDLEATVRSAAGAALESVNYLETYRDPQRDGTGHKRLLASIVLRSSDHTLTGEEADAIHRRIVASCSEKNGARLPS
jgi:phenylalanyl-tRNA synthetase beta chain